MNMPVRMIPYLGQRDDAEPMATINHGGQQRLLSLFLSDPGSPKTLDDLISVFYAPGQQKAFEPVQTIKGSISRLRDKGWDIQYDRGYRTWTLIAPARHGPDVLNVASGVKLRRVPLLHMWPPIPAYRRSNTIDDAMS